MKALVLALALACGSAHAEFWDGNTLLSRMGGTMGEQNAAIGYVMGVADVHHNVAQCAPEGVTAGQMRDMVRNYLTSYPAVRHLSADLLVLHVLKSTWPCAQRSGRGT